MDEIKSFRDLRIWQKSMYLVEKIYETTANFPKIETYGLISQMQRAVVSIPSNIAEGHRRRHNKEYRQFLNISPGSCGELETQIEIAKRLKYLSDGKYNELIEELDYLCGMIQTLITKLAHN